MAITRIKNNQITDASSGNVYLGINAAVKLQDYSITAGKIANSLVYGSDLTVTGNLTVNGSTTTIDTISVVIEDPVLYLAANQSGAPAVDIGFIGERGTSQNIAFVWDESAGEFVTVYTNDTTTNTTVTIASYASFHTNDANIGGNIVVNGTSSLIGNIINNANVTGNVNAGNMFTNGTIVALGNITGLNVNTAGNAEVGNVRISSLTSDRVVFTDANDYLITTQNFTYDGFTANIQGELIVDNYTFDNTSIVSNSSIEITAASTMALSSDIGNTTITANGAIVANAASSVEILSGGNSNINITPNGTGVVNIDNIAIADNTISSTSGNIVINPTGVVVLPDELPNAVLYSAGGSEIETSSNFTFDGTDANIQGSLVVDNINLNGNEISTQDTDGNLTLNPNGTGWVIIDGQNNQVTGNLFVEENLTVNGNLTYINIVDINVQDPIISLGRGANNAPLTTNDGKDRGTALWYYTGAEYEAFIGWDNSANVLIAAQQASIANEIVTVNNWGTFQMGNILSTGSAQINTTLTVPNITSNAGMSITTGAGSNGNLTIDPDGTGVIILPDELAQSIPYLDANKSIQTVNNFTFDGANLDLQGKAVIDNFTIDGTGITSNANATVTTTTNLDVAVGSNLAVNSGANIVATATTYIDVTAGSNISVTSGSNGNIDITPNGTGVVNIDNIAIADNTISSTNGNIVLDPAANVILTDELANSVLFLTANKEIQTVSNFTFDGANLVLVGKATIDNVIVDGNTITTDTDRLNFNSAAADIDFSFGGTAANLLYLDAGANSISIGSSTQVDGAKLAINSPDSMLIPVGNSAQRPSTPTTGMMRFNTTLDNLEFYDADSWVTAGSVFTVIDSQTFNGDGSTVAYTLDSDQTTDSCIVSINGVLQVPVVAYSVSGTTLTFTEAPLPSDLIEVRKLTTTVTVKAIANSNGNAQVEVEDTSSNVYITGNVVPTANVAQNLGSDTLRWKDLYLSGTSITLGNIILKNESGNTLAFYGPDGTTPGTLSSNNVDTTTIGNGVASVQTWSSSGNVSISAGGISNVFVADSGGIHVTGNIELTGNLLAPQIISVTAPLLYLDNEQNYPYDFDIGIYSGFVGGAGNTYQHTGIVRDDADSVWKVFSNVAEPVGNVVNFTNAIYDAMLVGQLKVNPAGNATAIINAGSNGVGNIGSSSTYFNTAFVKATSAQYADLAENYESDATYEPGTVVCFGGTKEVTICNVADCTRVAGVISTNPSYLMNSGQTGDHVAAVALQGRVPCKVTGQIRKGDLIVSAGDGRGCANNDARAGTIIGKALADFDGQDGVIEVVVGRV